MPSTTTTHLSHGTKSVLRSSRYQPSIEVSATVKARVAVANRELRCSQRTHAPIPTRAATAGARATV